jgi:predicted N-acetyltransferase YhbS
MGARVKIRRIEPEERTPADALRQIYGFRPSPATESTLQEVQWNGQFYEKNTTLVAEEAGQPVAEASAILMQQNLRGAVHPMVGIAGVTTSPTARRQGYGRAVVAELLGQMRDEGQILSTLYPFRPSFYQRVGYVGLPKAKAASFAPADLAGLLQTDLPGDVSLERADLGYDAIRAFTHRLLAERHGFARLPDYRAVQLRENNDRWVAVARVNDEVAAAVTYRILEFGGTLRADHLLTTSPWGRALLLRFFALHIDQVAKVVITVAPDETPELWATDLAVTTEAKTSFPISPTPMARVLSLEHLNGLPVGPGRVAVEVVDDPFVAGSYLLDGMGGRLEVSRNKVVEPTATLTVHGISGLIYGVLDPGDAIVRGFGHASIEAQQELRTIFPRAMPYVCAEF